MKYMEGGREETYAVILAGGYGCVRPGISKMVESISCAEEVPLVRCVANIPKNLGIQRVFAVVSTCYKTPIQKALCQTSCTYVDQNKRIGNGGALRLCLPFLDSSRHILVLYGDMPLWKCDTISALLESHMMTQATISMFSITIDSKTPPMVARYGRYLWDDNGEPCGLVEPFELTQEQLVKADKANPSVWVFDRRWLEENIAFLSWHKKTDGHHPEQQLPDLLDLAYYQKRRRNVVPLKEHWQALGVNTQEDLQDVQRVWKEKF